MENIDRAGNSQIKIGVLLAPFGPARGIMAHTYGRAVEQLQETGLAIEVRIDNMAGADQTAVDPDPAFMKWLDDDADLVLAHIPPAYDAVFTQLQTLHQETGKPVIPLSPECAAIAGGTDRQTIKTLWAYHGNGGLTNVRNLLRFVIHVSGFRTDDALPPPEEMPRCGIYHPDSLIFRADGEQLAQMLYTLGVKPVWDGSRITRLEVIPLETLKRPRVDITVQLSNMLRDTCHYAYGKGSFGVAARHAFTANLKHVSVTYDKWDSDEYDILECCHIFGSHGGFTQAVKTVSGKEVDVYFGDTHDPDRPRIRDMADELDRVARTRLLNPTWIESKKRHGYKGATVMADRIYHIYGWQATTRLVGNWVFDDIARTFALDEEMRRWFEANNPYALESITRRLIEADQRSLWQADPELLEQLRQVFLEVEGWMEDRMEDVTGDFQGSDIDIVKIDQYKVAK